MASIVEKKDQAQFRAVAPPWEFYEGQTGLNARCSRCGMVYASEAAARAGTCPNCIKRSRR